MSLGIGVTRFNVKITIVESKTNLNRLNSYREISILLKTFALIINRVKPSNNKPCSSKNNWPLHLIVLILVFLMSSIITLSITKPDDVNTVIKTKISNLTAIENLGYVQSVQVTHIGLMSFYKYNFFAHDNHQVSAKAIQVLGFSPQITCVSGSSAYRCQ